MLTFDEKRHSILGTQLRLIESLEPGKRHGPIRLTTDQFRAIQFLRLGALVNRRQAGPELSEGLHTVQLEFVVQRPKEGPLLVSSKPVKLKVSLAPYPVEKAVGMIRDGLKDKNLTVRRNSALLAGQLRLAGCRDDLIRALKDKDLILRKYACQSLGELKDPAAIESLKDLLEDKSLDLRLQAARSLTDLGLPLQQHWIEPIIKSKKTNEYQGAIMLAREKLGKKAVPMLIRSLDFDDPSVRNHRNYVLVQQIGACGGPRHTYYRNLRRTGGTEKQIAHNQRVLLDLKALVIEDL